MTRTFIEPGDLPDHDLGIPGPAEPMPDDDRDQDEDMLVNEEE